MYGHFTSSVNGSTRAQYLISARKQSQSEYVLYSVMHILLFGLCVFFFVSSCSLLMGVGYKEERGVFVERNQRFCTAVC